MPPKVASPIHVPASLLFERDDLLAALSSDLDLASRGRGRAVLVGGEAGIGKTSLLRRFTNDHAAARVLWGGGCEALSTPRPLGPLHDLAPQWSDTLRGLLANPGDRSVLFAAVLDELGRPGITRSATILVIDDIHWADAATLDLIKFIGRRVEGLPLLMLLGYRDDDASLGALRPVFGDLPTTTRRMPVPRLSRVAVDAMSKRAEHGDARFHDACLYDATGGNPFFVSEVLAHVDAGSGVPATVRDAVLGRAALLSKEARAVLDLAAIVPRSIEASLIDAVLGSSVEAIEACVACGLLIADGPCLHFRHELARVAVETELLSLKALRLHARVFSILSSDAAAPAPGALARIAHHAKGAADAAGVLHWAPLAANEAALRGARREAAAHCRAALEFADRLDVAMHAELLDIYATHCFELNDLAAAIPARDAAIARFAEVGDRPAQVIAMGAQAMALVRALRNAEADAISRQAIALARQFPPGPALAAAYATECYLRMLNREVDEAVEWGEKACRLAEQLDDRPLLARALNAIGGALLFTDYARGAALVRRSMDIGASIADGGAAVAHGYLMLGTASGEVYAFDAAERCLDEGIAFASARDLDRQAGYMAAWQALCDVYRGRWDLASERAHRVVSHDRSESTNRLTALIALGRLRCRRGDPGAMQALDEALALARQSGTLQRVGHVCCARAEAAWLARDFDRMRAEIDLAIGLAEARRHPWFFGELAFWRWRAEGSPVMSTAPSMCAGPYALQMVGNWQAAADEWQRLGCPYEGARALADGDACACLEALAITDRLGAGPLADAVRSRMRSIGEAFVPRGPRASTRGNAAGLTLRELQVLSLVAQGLGNAAIAARLSRSPRTVDHHVESILSKLDAQNRGDAVAAARRLGIELEK